MLAFENQFIVLQNPFDPIRTGVSSLEALTEHRWNSINLYFSSKPQSLFTYNLKSSYGGYFQKGNRWLFFSEMGYRFQPYVELNSLVSYNHILLEKPWGVNGFWLLGVKSNFTFTKNVFFPTYINTMNNKGCGTLIQDFSGGTNLLQTYFWCLTAVILICWYQTEIGT